MACRRFIPARTGDCNDGVTVKGAVSASISIENVVWGAYGGVGDANGKLFCCKGSFDGIEKFSRSLPLSLSFSRPER